MCNPRYAFNSPSYGYGYGYGYDGEFASPYQRPYIQPYRPSPGYGVVPVHGHGIDPVQGLFGTLGCPKDRKYRPVPGFYPGMPMHTAGMPRPCGYGGGQMVGMPAVQPFGFSSSGSGIHPLVPYTKLRRPYATTCLKCGSLITTVTHHRIGTLSTASALCLTPILMCWLPLVCNKFKDVVHYCPCCGCQVAIHKAAH